MIDHSHKFVSCENCGARNKSLFAGLHGEQVEDLNEHKACSHYKKNQGLFLEGSIPRGVFCVNKGKVKVFAIGDEGKEQIIQIAKAAEKKITKALGLTISPGGSPVNKNANNAATRASK